jgi:hypothetical protein
LLFLGEPAPVAVERLDDAETRLERLEALGIVALNGWAYHSLGCACLTLGRLAEACRLGQRLLESPTLVDPRSAGRARPTGS